MLFQKGYHKLFCSQCQKETWHYQPEIGPIHCCVHNKNLVRGTVDPSLPKPDYSRQGHKLDMSLWQRSMENRRDAGVEAPSDLGQILFTPDEIGEIFKDPDMVVCSFCGTQVSNVTSNWENWIKIKKVREPYLDVEGNIQMQEKRVINKRKVIACQNCVGKLKAPQVVRTV
jgi:hypothetical protein